MRFMYSEIHDQFNRFSIIASRRMDGAVAWILMASALAVLVSCHQVCFIGSEYNPQSGIPSRWFLPYKDPCKCTAIRLGGMRIPASSNLQGAPYYLIELVLSEDSDEIQAYFNCSRERTGCSSPEPLGMEDETIPDDHISASSFGNLCCTAQMGRMNSGSVWVPQSDTGSWIEVDLATSTVVSGVTTKGWLSVDFNGYVTKYNVTYKKQPSSEYKTVTDENGNVKEFEGNINGLAMVTNLFHESVVAKVVRIEPTAWYDRVRLQFELLGCRRN